MTNTDLKLPVRGIIPPPVTPLIGNNTPDEEGPERLIGHIIKGGVNGVFISGTTSENAVVSNRLRENPI